MAFEWAEKTMPTKKITISLSLSLLHSYISKFGVRACLCVNECAPFKSVYFFYLILNFWSTLKFPTKRKLQQTYRSQLKQTTEHTKDTEETQKQLLCYQVQCELKWFLFCEIAFIRRLIFNLNRKKWTRKTVECSIIITWNHLIQPFFINSR